MLLKPFDDRGPDDAAPACLSDQNAAPRACSNTLKGVVLRGYLRQRERLLDYAASHTQHMQKALTQMNLQLHHVVTDITGTTGMAIIRAVVAGERDPAMLAAHRHQRCQRCHASMETIRQALVGNDREEHVFAELHLATNQRNSPSVCFRMSPKSGSVAEARAKGMLDDCCARLRRSRSGD